MTLATHLAWTLLESTLTGQQAKFQKWLRAALIFSASLMLGFALITVHSAKQYDLHEHTLTIPLFPPLFLSLVAAFCFGGFAVIYLIVMYLQDFIQTVQAWLQRKAQNALTSAMQSLLQ